MTIKTEYRNSKGLLHKEGEPAREWGSGLKEWCINGKYHRLDGPAIEWANGDKSWYKDGKLHREDGPAIDWGIAKEWWIEDKRYLKVIDDKFIIINGEKFLSVGDNTISHLSISAVKESSMGSNNVSIIDSKFNGKKRILCRW